MNVTTEQLFTEARTANAYLPTPVAEATLRELYELTKWGPTASNSSPMRLIFVTSDEAKARLVPCMAPGGNQAKVGQAPVTAIVGMDMAFYEHLPRLYPQVDFRKMFIDNPARVPDAALRNSSLQGAYLMLAARALGLDCGPMGGFNAAAVDAAFWAGTTVRTNFICTLGKADPAGVRPRNPRLSFEEACQVL